MPDQLVAAVANAVLAAADLNTNWDMIEDALLDLGPYVITGLVPAAGTGLAVDVTAGTAVIGARVTKASPFTISGLADNTVNHLYLNRDGTTAHNTTGVQPAESVKLGTATTLAGVVDSVDTSPISGRQEKVDLAALVSSGANAFTDVQMITLTDASGAAVSRPLVLRHANSGGVGANGIGAGIDLQVETASEGVFEPAGRIDARTTSAVAGAVSAVLDLSVPALGVMATPVSIAAASVELEEAVNLVFGTVTGTKIGTSTAQMLSFWNATPVAQQVLATGGGATVDQVITLLQTLGLCRQA